MQCLGLPSRPVQRQHVLAPPTLTDRMLFDQTLELTHELEMTSSVQIRLHPLLQRRKPELFELGNVWLGERLEREIGERWAAPECQRLAQQLCAPFRSCAS